MHNAGYDVRDRGKVTTRLRKICEALRRHKRLEHPQITVIPKARIPIIKVGAGAGAGAGAGGVGTGPKCGPAAPHTIVPPATRRGTAAACVPLLPLLLRPGCACSYTCCSCHCWLTMAARLHPFPSPPCRAAEGAQRAGGHLHQRRVRAQGCTLPGAAGAAGACTQAPPWSRAQHRRGWVALVCGARQACSFVSERRSPF